MRQTRLSHIKIVTGIFRHSMPLIAAMVVLLCAGCACGRVGTLASRRTITGSADIIDVYAFGALLRPQAVDGGFTLGWRHATYIYPRIAGDGAEEGASWTFGWAPQRRETPFFLAARSLGGEVASHPGVIQAHAGFRADAFTFAARADESRVVLFSYRDDAPGQTYLAMNPPPPLALP